MTDSASSKESADRLVEELQNYLRVRAEHALVDVGERLGDTAARLAAPGTGLGSMLGSAAKGSVSTGGGLVKDLLKQQFKKVTGGKDDGKKSGGKGKTTTVVEDIDIGVPVSDVYNQWTRFNEFESFTKGVTGVDQRDETTSDWHVKVARSHRNWKAHVEEQVPDERIVWTSEAPKGSTRGVVTFHPLGDSLTKVLLVLEYTPQGPVEKIGNLWRAQGRRARLDLKLFRAYLMTQGEQPEGWRGEIREGEVVSEEPEGEEDEAEEDEDEAVDDEEKEAGEDEAYEDEQYEDEQYEEDEEEGEDTRERGRRRRTPAAR
ncbi:SRPBCC family protein [Streptomyces scopuliridis]|uniref:SRPBCC family protein n=1 Tax=Streptomyces scopuliridis TaxID=452529 RepID=A0ACD4ZK19_9ACTN|nr:SRPBCC family protein [Streptomyces scopuliridis]WSB33886.1 SRPBCC family protein [Streptomyces scopuliridis]WSB98166.1 SRPBCC family protein [Streptomyces scopuliridis]WSC08132.1 SRPBCC family protein [Streptomyces scopuliridis]